MAYNKNGKYTKEQITNLLYSYMVEGQSAAYVCKYILGMSEAEIGNTKFAWRKIQRYYNSYGFQKRYNNGSAFRNISKNKLQNYVSLYWNKNATEKDLIAFFPEIFNDLNEAKKLEGERELQRENSWGSSTSTRNTSYSSANFEKRNPKNHTDYNTVQTNVAQNNPLIHNTTYSKDTNSYHTPRESGSKDTDNYYTSRETGSKHTKNYYTPKETGSKHAYKTNTPWKQMNPINNGSKSGYEINSSDSGNIIAIIIFIIAIIAIGKSGIISTLFYGISNVFNNIFWILELLFFYGGIVLFIISLFKKTTRRIWKGCIGFSALGLCFGFFSTGDFLEGIILGILGLAFISANRY